MLIEFSSNNIDAYRGLLLEICRSDIKEKSLVELCSRVLHNEQFCNGYGSKSRREEGENKDSTHNHHSYRGGLLVHTYEVAKYCLGMGKMLYANLDILLTAAVFHDFGKVYDYQEVKTETGYYAEGTEHRKLVIHLPASYAYFCSQCPDTMDEGLKLKIEHCILAHHGRREWGSPVEPKTLEAYILHYADMLSRFYGPGAQRSCIQG